MLPAQLQQHLLTGEPMTTPSGPELLYSTAVLEQSGHATALPAPLESVFLTVL